MDPFEVMQQQINDLRQEVKTLRSQQVLRGEVRSVNPLRISLDLDPNTVLADAPENIAPVLNIGDFVYCQLVGGRLIILGRSITASDTDNIMMINGVSYKRYGSVRVSGINFTAAHGPLYRADVYPSFPENLPAGWTREVVVLGGPGTVCWAGYKEDTETTNPRIALISGTSGQNRTADIEWIVKAV